MTIPFTPEPPKNPLPYRSYWSFSGTVQESVWATVEVPVDYATGTLEVFIWTERPSIGTNSSISTRWGFSAHTANRPVAGSGNVLGNLTGAATITHPIRSEVAYWGWPWLAPIPTVIYTGWRYSQRDSIGTMAVAAGDLIHAEIYRDPTHVGDTYTLSMALFLVEFVYTADS